MNKTIQALIEQATTEEKDGFKYFNKEKFAELIIKECVKKQLALAANYETVVPGYESAFPEFVDGTVNGLKEGCELILQILE
jgi:hypothetical protein